jgi:hypothetical protein
MRNIHGHGFLTLLVPVLVACGPALELEGASCTDEACGEGVATATQGLVSQAIEGSWTCAAGQSCEDQYEFTVAANTRVTIRLNGMTGGSIARLAAFGPNSPNTNNLLTGTTDRWSCNGVASDAVSFLAISAGKYFIRIGRDGSSPGTTGTYRGFLDAEPSMTFIGPTPNTNDVASFNPKRCGWERTINASFNCPTQVSCQNVWDFDVQANTTLGHSVSLVPSSADLSLAAFAPGISLDNFSLYDGFKSNRSCKGRGQSEGTMVLARAAGRYRLAVTREDRLSAATPRTGSYQVTFKSRQPLAEFGQTVANTPKTMQGTPDCLYQFGLGGRWTQGAGTCPLGAEGPCQDVYDFSLVNSAPVTVGVTRIDSAYAARLAVFRGAGVHTTNLLNGLRSDRLCANEGEPDSATSSAVQGNIRIAIGRAEGERGIDRSGGTYDAVISSTEPLSPASPTLTLDNVSPTLTATSCP